MIKVGDKVKYIGPRCFLKEGEILIVDCVKILKETVPTTFEIGFKGYSEKWIFPDSALFELVIESVGIKHDSNKLRFDLIPAECEAMIAAVFTLGAMKYAPDNWKKIEDIQPRYFSAERRHMNAKRLDEMFDPEFGLPHSAHAIVSLIFTLWEDIRDNIGRENVLSFITEKLKNYKDMLDKK